MGVRDGVKEAARNGAQPRTGIKGDAEWACSRAMTGKHLRISELRPVWIAWMGSCVHFISSEHGRCFYKILRYNEC